MCSQITFAKKTHPQGLPVYQNLKLKTDKPKVPEFMQPHRFNHSITIRVFEAGELSIKEGVYGMSHQMTVLEHVFSPSLSTNRWETAVTKLPMH